jgi:DNA end-binding protein Ku
MASRTMWDGVLDFGPLVIPVKLTKGTNPGDGPELHWYRKSDGSAVEFRRFAVADGAELSFSEMSKGAELSDGRVVLLDKDDLSLAFGDKNRTAKILTFTTRAFPLSAPDGSYIVNPGKNGEAAYALLAAALERTGKSAVVSFAPGTRERLAVLKSEGGYLTLYPLHWASDVRKPEFAAPVASDEKMIELAQNLVDLSTSDFDWEARTDPSAEALAQLVQAKADTGQVTGTAPARPAGSPTAAADLMSVLTASVAQAKKNRNPAPARTRAPRSRKAAATV